MKKLVFLVVIAFLFVSPCRISEAQQIQNGVLRLGGFKCVDLSLLKNDSTFDLYSSGYWASGSFRMDVWKRHGVPFLYQQNLGDICVSANSKKLPAEVTIPLGGNSAKEIYFIGNVANPVNPASDSMVAVGEYVLVYEDGSREAVPLIIGKNVASMRYGHFVPEAEVAFVMIDEDSSKTVQKQYHLDEWLPIEPKKQLMKFSYKPQSPDKPLKELIFRCTREGKSLYLAAITLHESGPKISPLFYNGKIVKPYPDDFPKAQPCPLEKLRNSKNELSLDGEWRYKTDPGNIGVKSKWFATNFDRSDWLAMPVPSQWFVQGLDYHGVVWFSREFYVPKDFPGSAMELWFGAVDYDARVWVNGEFVGKHKGSHSSFKLNATQFIKKGASNLIVVRVDSPIDPGLISQKTLIKGSSTDDISRPFAQEGCQGGIYRSVKLLGRGNVVIENAWTVTKLSSDLEKATVKVKFDLIPNQGFMGNVTVNCRLTEPTLGASKPRVFEAKKDVQLRSKSPVDIQIKIDNPKLWQPWEQGTPYLHTMVIEVKRGSQILDRHIAHVGVREISFNEKQSCLYVNHHRIFLKGQVMDDVHWMSLMDRTGYKHRIQMMKDANINIIRLHTHQSSPEFYDLCDEMGMMVWQDMPLHGSYSKSEAVRNDIKQIIAETMQQCRTHASVIGWTAWSEGGLDEFGQKLANMMRKLDPSGRPVSSSSGADFDVRLYPNLASNLSKLTPLWTGIKAGFVSEAGAFGLSSVNEMKEILGDNLFPFDSADYYWDSWNAYRCVDGPVFLDSPAIADWPAEKIQSYMLSKVGASERWLCQYMKFMYETMRAQRFEPATSIISSRFDDPVPSAYLGIVNFSGKPRKAYHSVKQACQQILPILYFSYLGVKDIRVVNDYWNRGWKDCRLHYIIRSHDGKVFKEDTHTFSLEPDSVSIVVPGDMIGNIFSLPGFSAEITVKDKDGKLLAKNAYDLTEDEIHTFVTSVYPPAPFDPYGSFLSKISEAVLMKGVCATPNSMMIYSPCMLEIGGDEYDPRVKFAVFAREDGDYVFRVACNSGEVLRSLTCTVDGQKVELESYPYIDMTQPITRMPFGDQKIGWYPGWVMNLKKGTHYIELVWPDGTPKPKLIIDAACLQRYERKGTLSLLK